MRGFGSIFHLRRREDGCGRVLTEGEVGGDRLLDLRVPTEWAEHRRGHHLPQATWSFGVAVWGRKERKRGGGRRRRSEVRRKEGEVQGKEDGGKREGREGEGGRGREGGKRGRVKKGREREEKRSEECLCNFRTLPSFCALGEHLW